MEKIQIIILKKKKNITTKYINLTIMNKNTWYWIKNRKKNTWIKLPYYFRLFCVQNVGHEGKSTLPDLVRLGPTPLKSKVSYIFPLTTKFKRCFTFCTFSPKQKIVEEKKKEKERHFAVPFTILNQIF